MKKCYRITIGNFEAEIDHRGMIITCDEKIKSLLYQNINEVFKKYQHRTTFKKITTIHYPVIVPDDKYNIFLAKNPILDLLKEKFECEIY